MAASIFKIEDESVIRTNLISDLLPEKSLIYTYKFTDEQLRKMCLKNKCKVKMGNANLLNRLELKQFVQNNKGQKKKMNKAKQIQVAKKAMIHYQRDYAKLHEKQSNREYSLMRKQKELWLVNRIKAFESFNINIIGLIAKEEVLTENNVPRVNKFVAEYFNRTHIKEFNKVSYDGYHIYRYGDIRKAAKHFRRNLRIREIHERQFFGIISKKEEARLITTLFGVEFVSTNGHEFATKC